MSKKKDEKPANVKLKSIFGIPPGLYLLVLYIFIALLIIFLTLFLPGIIQNGSKVSFSSTPNGAAVYCDDIYIGSGQFTAFIPKGKHTFRLEKPGFISETVLMDIRGRIALSWIFPRRESIMINLTLDSLENYLAWRAESLYSWSFITDYNSSYFYPELYTELAEDLASSSLSSGQITRVMEFYNHVGALISSEKMLDDYIYGDSILTAEYNKPFAMDSHIELLQSYFSGTGDPPNLPDSTGTDPVSSANYDTSENINVLNIEYVKLSGDRIIVGKPDFSNTSKLTEYPSIVDLNQFYIAAREISVKDYWLFVENNPNWSIDNKTNLLADGLVDDQYLLGVDLSNFNDMPIRNISWYAAKAFCEWQTAYMSLESSDLYISLPTTSQWQYAASIFAHTYSSTFVSAPVFTKLPVNLMGNVWEFSDDIFIPTGSSLFDNIDSELESSWIQRVVKGGSWANSASNISIYTIGSIEPYSCSEFIGFRTVLLNTE